MLARTERPHMRLATAQLAALADGAAPALLAEISAELAHRDRKPARRLAEHVAALLGGTAPAAYAPPARIAPEPERIECVNGEIVPEQRETVISVERITATEAPLRTAPAPRRASNDAVAAALAWLTGYPAGKREANRLRRAMTGANADHARAALLAAHAWRTRREVLPVPPAAIRPAAPDWCEAFGWPSEAAWKEAAQRAPRITAPAGTPACDAEHAAWRAFMAKARLAAIAATAPAADPGPARTAPPAARPATRRAAF